MNAARVKALIVPHTCIIPWYRVELGLFGQYEDMELHALIPPAWRSAPDGARMDVSQAPNAPYRLWVRPTYGGGLVRRYFFAPSAVSRLLSRLRSGPVHVEAESGNLVRTVRGNDSGPAVGRTRP